MRTALIWLLAIGASVPLSAPVSSRAEVDSTYSPSERAHWIPASHSAAEPAPALPGETSAHSEARRGSPVLRALAPAARPALPRLVLWGALSASQGILAYEKTIDVWGRPSGKLHLKNDLDGDRMALNDEASHLFIAYKLTELARLGFRWSGLSPRAAARAGAVQAAAYMLFVEFPLDAFNPAQGFGISDALANLAGVGLAWYRSDAIDPRWDLKVSVKSRFFEGDSRLIAHTNQQYDDYIYWLTYRMSRNRYNPLVIGVGYSTAHPPDRPTRKEIYVRVGTSLSEVGRFISRRIERVLSPGAFYFLSVGPRVSWE